MINCNENFKLNLTHFLDMYPNPCLFMPFHSVVYKVMIWKISRTLENQEDKDIVG